MVKEIDIFDKVCMMFMFKEPEKEGGEYDTLLFVKKKHIFSLNYEKETIRIIYQFKDDLNLQPNYFISNDIQTIFLIGSQDDGCWVNLE